MTIGVKLAIYTFEMVHFGSFVSRSGAKEYTANFMSIGHVMTFITSHSIIKKQQKEKEDMKKKTNPRNRYNLSQQELDNCRRFR